MPSRRGGNWCGVLGLLLVLAFVPAALAAQRGDGSSPAAAHQLTPGVPFHGTTAGATLDSWFNYNDFSQIALKAGDYLTVDWIGGTSSKTGAENNLDMLAPGTTSFIPGHSEKPLFELWPFAETNYGAVFKLSQRYLVKTTGMYIFDANTIPSTLRAPGGPYTLTVYVQHGAKGATCPLQVQASLAKRVSTVTAREPGIGPKEPGGVSIGLGRLQANGKYLTVPYGGITMSDTAAANGEWSFVASSKVLAPGHYRWVVGAAAVVRDSRGFVCVPATIYKTFEIK